MTTVYQSTRKFNAPSQFYGDIQINRTKFPKPVYGIRNNIGLFDNYGCDYTQSGQNNNGMLQGGIIGGLLGLLSGGGTNGMLRGGIFGAIFGGLFGGESGGLLGGLFGGGGMFGGDSLGLGLNDYTMASQAGDYIGNFSNITDNLLNNKVNGNGTGNQVNNVDPDVATLQAAMDTAGPNGTAADYDKLQTAVKNAWDTYNANQAAIKAQEDKTKSAKDAVGAKQQEIGKKDEEINKYNKEIIPDLETKLSDANSAVDTAQSELNNAKPEDKAAAQAKLNGALENQRLAKEALDKAEKELQDAQDQKRGFEKEKADLEQALADEEKTLAGLNSKSRLLEDKIKDANKVLDKRGKAITNPGAAANQQPKDEVVTQQPKDEVVTQQPKDEVVTQQPKDEVVTQQPKDEVVTQQPKDEVVSEAPTVETMLADIKANKDLTDDEKALKEVYDRALKAGLKEEAIKGLTKEQLEAKIKDLPATEDQQPKEGVVEQQPETLTVGHALEDEYGRKPLNAEETDIMALYDKAQKLGINNIPFGTTKEKLQDMIDHSYKVNDKDTIANIASQYGISTKELLDANPGIMQSKANLHRTKEQVKKGIIFIYPGQVLTLPEKAKKQNK